MKTLVTLIAAITLLTLGCTSTVTLGPKANESKLLGASAGQEGVSLTLPLVRGEVLPTEATPKE
jgi:hypothetical protein